MKIKEKDIICDFCLHPLTEFGGLIFSPPDSYSHCKKRHICKPCYSKILPMLYPPTEQKECVCPEPKKEVIEYLGGGNIPCYKLNCGKCGKPIPKETLPEPEQKECLHDGDKMGGSDCPTICCKCGNPIPAEKKEEKRFGDICLKCGYEKILHNCPECSNLLKPEPKPKDRIEPLGEPIWIDLSELVKAMNEIRRIIVAGERILYKIFKDKMVKADPNAFVYKIPDTFGIGGMRPFDTFCVIQGVPFAIEFKSKNGTLTKYQAYQLQDFILAGGESLVYWEDITDMTSFVETIMKKVKERKK